MRSWGGQLSARKEERFANNLLIKRRFIERNRELIGPGHERRIWAHFFVTRGNWRLGCRQWGLAARDYALAFRYRPYDGRLWRCVARATSRRGRATASE